MAVAVRVMFLAMISPSDVSELMVPDDVMLTVPLRAETVPARITEPTESMLTWPELPMKVMPMPWSALRVWTLLIRVPAL